MLLFSLDSVTVFAISVHIQKVIGNQVYVV